MIDYLELLLDEQEQEETQREPVELGQTLAAAARYRTTNSTVADASQTRSVGSAEAERGTNGATADMSEIQTPLSSDVLHSQEDGMLSFALRWQESWLAPNRFHSWAAGLYRETITAAQSNAALRQRGSSVLRVAEPAASADTLNIARLDDAFARDARRYDNGFFMY